MESVGNSLWFEQLVERLGHQLWIGDAAQIRASYVRKQKTDKRDAGHILKLLLENVPSDLGAVAPTTGSAAVTDSPSQLVGMRTRIKDRVAACGIEPGMQKKRSLWSKGGMSDLKKLSLEGWTSRRRADLLSLLSMLETQVSELDKAVEEAARRDPQAQLLMTQPGVGPNTALAFVTTIGDVARFPRGKQVASYLGLIRANAARGASAGWERSPNKAMCFFVRCWSKRHSRQCVMMRISKKEYRHHCHHKPKGVVKVAVARKLAVRLYWMLRTQTPYPQVVHNEGSPSHFVVSQS